MHVLRSCPRWDAWTSVRRNVEAPSPARTAGTSGTREGTVPAGTQHWTCTARTGRRRSWPVAGVRCETARRRRRPEGRSDVDVGQIPEIRKGMIQERLDRRIIPVVVDAVVARRRDAPRKQRRARQKGCPRQKRKKTAQLHGNLPCAFARVAAKPGLERGITPIRTRRGAYHINSPIPFSSRRETPLQYFDRRCRHGAPSFPF